MPSRGAGVLWPRGRAAVGRRERGETAEPCSRWTEDQAVDTSLNHPVDPIDPGAVVEVLDHDPGAAVLYKGPVARAGDLPHDGYYQARIQHDVDAAQRDVVVTVVDGTATAVLSLPGECWISIERQYAPPLAVGPYANEAAAIHAMSEAPLIDEPCEWDVASSNRSLKKGV